jgi:hypothetical protein
MTVFDNLIPNLVKVVEEAEGVSSNKVIPITQKFCGSPRIFVGNR